MCVDIWVRPPCGHSVYQNTFQCTQATAATPESQYTPSFEDELANGRTSSSELRQRRLSSLSSWLSHSSPSLSSARTACRVTKAIRPVHEHECSECAREWHHHHQWRYPQDPYEQYDPNHFYAGSAFGGSSVGSFGMSPMATPMNTTYDYSQEANTGRRHPRGHRRSVSSTQVLEDSFVMIARRQRLLPGEEIDV